jgi:hypothetical protein
MARKREGRLLFTAGRGYVAQLTIDVPGKAKPVRKVFPLVPDDAPPLTDRAYAKRLMRRLIAARALGSPEAPASTVDAFAIPWLEARAARGIAAAKYERRYYERVWSPEIGRMHLAYVKRVHLQSVLDRMASGEIVSALGTPYARETVQHMRATIGRVLNAAWKAELVQENVARRTDMPEIEDVKKPRVVLSDHEIAALVACPDVDHEIKVLVLFARTVAGLRTGDLNRAVWENFGPGFETYTFVRRKTRKKRPYPETHEIPEAVRPYFVAWHEAHGRPESGPVFPVRRVAKRGDRVGKFKLESKYAKPLRRELLKAGVTRHEVHHDTETTRRVDFHSCRRAYSTALARAGLNAQEAMLLTGHADAKVHARYVDGLKVRALPPAAVPNLFPVPFAGPPLTLAAKNKPARVSEPYPDQLGGRPFGDHGEAPKLQ